MERYVLDYKGSKYNFNTDKELKKYLEENNINKKLENNNMMMVYNFVGKVATIKIIKKYC